MSSPARTLAASFPRVRLVDEITRHLRELIVTGQLPAGTDVPADADQLVGPVYYRVLVTGEPAGRPFTDRLVDSYLRGLSQ